MRRCSREQSRDRKEASFAPGPALRSLTVAALLLCVFNVSPCASAQWLELSARPDPPPLGEDTYAASLAAQLDEEIDQSGGDEVTTRAGANLRRLARAMLLSASDDPAEASTLTFRGMKLHDQREAIDAALERIARNQTRTHRRDEDAAAASAATKRLREFNDVIERRLARSAPLSDEEAAALLALLDSGIHNYSGGESSLPKPTFDDLRTQARADDAIHAIVSEIAEFFERGWAFADLRPRIVGWHALAAESLGYFTAVTDATWLSETQRRACFDRLRAALLAFRDPQQRSEGERLLRAVIAEAQFLRAVTTLSQNRAHRVDLDPLRASLIRAHRTWGFSAAEADIDGLIERLNWLATIADRMNRFRALDRDDTPLDLRRIRVQVVDGYLATERALLKKIESMVTQRRSAVADPSLAALLSEHRRLLDDLARLQSMSRWTDAITLIRPASAVKFGDQVRRLAHLLGDPVRRVDAAFAMDRIESEIARYWPMPFEDELRMRSRIAERATGGRYREFLEEIDAQRDRWARELGEEGPALARPAAQRLEMIHQLLGAMADVAELLRDENAAARLNSDDDWWMTAEAPQAAIERLLPILERAVHAAVEDDEQRLLSELRAIEREGPIARLIGRRLNNHDARSFDRADLALICRYAVEAVHAHSKERTREARELWRFANRMAAIVMREP